MIKPLICAFSVRAPPIRVAAHPQRRQKTQSHAKFTFCDHRYIESFPVRLVRCGTLKRAFRTVWRPETPTNGGKIAESAMFSCGFARQVHDYVALPAILW
jgi:hypothetical protein